MKRTSVRSPQLAIGADLCPPWFAWVLNNPLRRRLHNAEAILDGLVEPGFTVVELGCGSGPFTIALARIVGPSGRVIAADLQPAMLAKVAKRVAQSGMQDRVALHHCARERVGLTLPVDFVLAFWMVHEVPSASALFAEMHQALKPAGRLLLVEPKIHVARHVFEAEVDAALRAGFQLQSKPCVRFSRAALLSKRDGNIE